MPNPLLYGKWLNSLGVRGSAACDKPLHNIGEGIALYGHTV